MMQLKKTLFSFLLSLLPLTLWAEDGSKLWLRYNDSKTATVHTLFESPTIELAKEELQHNWKGRQVEMLIDPTIIEQDGYSIDVKDVNHVVLKGNTHTALLYAAYELLRMQAIGNLHTLTTAPYYKLRILDHWDNLNGSIERGYAGKSIFKWKNIEKQVDIIRAYARANASIGINGSVLNNVNASPKILTNEYLNKIKFVADLLRPYGIRTYLSINFASPMLIGKLPTADPLDENVQQWWKEKVKEIYQLIPDFGGFLVKANSEGQPGPGDYKRSHADGANMLAEALQPYNGIVMWRCFVYGNHKGEDRVKQAVSEFLPLDGLFKSNVILQCKNGPLDFQPREPYAPVFDQIRKTPLMAEFQITQEYLGQSKHLVYLAPMWEEFFSFVSSQSIRGIAGVANIGDNENWCGHHFSQANWYAFGRMAWNPAFTSDSIADEWLRQTFCSSPVFLTAMKRVMMGSREACVDYMMPLGLHHIFKADHHYGPEPQGNQAHFPLEWRPVYYHKADQYGIGFDRSNKGTNAVAQYRHPYDNIYNDTATCPDEYLLWFHHVSWQHRMHSGRTLWEEINYRYNRGVDKVEQYITTWHKMKPYVDKQRYDDVDKSLAVQLTDAREWKRVCLNYFGDFVKK